MNSCLDSWPLCLPVGGPQERQENDKILRPDIWELQSVRGVLCLAQKINGTCLSRPGLFWAFKLVETSDTIEYDRMKTTPRP